MPSPTELDQQVSDADFALVPSCANCGRSLQGSYCCQCGQRDRSLHDTFWNFLKELLGEVFEADARVWRTLGPLFLRPGYLSDDYLAGRRARYLPPLRLYLMSSLLFFLLNAVISGPVKVQVNGDEGAVVAVGMDQAQKERLVEILEREGLDDLAAALPEADTRPSEGDAVPALTESASDGATGADASAQPSAEESGDGDLRISFGSDAEGLSDWQRATLQDLEGRAREAGDDPEAFMQEVLERTPTVLFMTLPLFALLSRILWLGAGRWYMEHLVFALHLFSLTYLLMSLELLLDGFSALEVAGSGMAGRLSVALMLYLCGYWLLALRRFFAGGWFSTTLRAGMLAISYGVVIILAFVLMSIVVLLTN